MAQLPVTTIRMPQEERDWLAATAKKHGLSQSDVVRRALRAIRNGDAALPFVLVERTDAVGAQGRADFRS